LALELETSVENEDWLVDLDPLGTSSLELSQELLVDGRFCEEGDRSKVGGSTLAALPNHR